MARRDLVTGFVWLGVGVLFCAGALRYKLMHLGAYGPGFYPFVMACALIGLAAALIFVSYFHPEEPPPGATAERNTARIVLVLIALFGYGFLLPYAGFLLTTFVLILFLLRYVEPVRWGTAVLAAAAATGISYALFVRWLGVQMPRGIFYL